MPYTMKVAVSQLTYRRIDEIAKRSGKTVEEVAGMLLREGTGQKLPKNVFDKAIKDLLPWLSNRIKVKVK